MISIEINGSPGHLAKRIQEGLNSTELLAQFRNLDIWQAESQATEETLRLLGQHSNNYFSPLPSTYLFEMKSLASINYFSPLIVRDGALTLLHFFQQNPRPTSDTAFLIIKDSLKDLIPNSWRQNTATYQLQTTKYFHPVDEIKVLFLLTQLGPKQCSRKYISDTFDKIKSQLGSRKLSVFVCSIQPQFSEDLTIRDELAKDQAQLLGEIIQLSGAPPHFISPSEIESGHFQDYLFHDLSEFDFYYSDSYFTHALLLRGAHPLAGKLKASDPSIEIPLSPNHKICFELPNQNDSKYLHIIWDQYRKSNLLTSEDLTYQPKKISFENKICSPSFEDFAFEVAKILDRNL